MADRWSRKRRIAIGLSVSFVSLVLFSLLLEGVLRLGLQEQFPILKVCSGPKVLRKFDPQLNTTGTPNGTYLIKYTGEDAWDLYTHNDSGFRDTYASGSSAVLVLGDSMTYGALVSDESTYTDLLDRWSADVEFKNYGFPTYGTAQELLLYRRVAGAIEHDLVILGYFSNDPADNARRDQSRFRLSEGQLTLGPPLEGRGLITVGFIDRAQRFLADHTATYDFFAPKLKRVLSKLEANEDPPAVEISEVELEERADLTRALIQELAAEAGRHGASLLIVALTRIEAVEGTPDDTTGFSWDNQVRMLGEISRDAANVDLLDMTPHLKNEMDQGNRVYGKLDLHLDDYGHYVVARAIFNRLVEDGYINGPAASALAFDDAKTDVDRCP